MKLRAPVPPPPVWGRCAPRARQRCARRRRSCRTRGRSARPRRYGADRCQGVHGVRADARKAEPTTTVGITNGTVNAARSSRLPLNSKRAKTKAAGRATTTVTIVDTTACHSVNQATLRRFSSVRISPNASRFRRRPVRATGWPRADRRRSSRGTAAGQRPATRFGPGVVGRVTERSRSTLRSTSPGSLR